MLDNKWGGLVERVEEKKNWGTVPITQKVNIQKKRRRKKKRKRYKTLGSGSGKRA